MLWKNERSIILEMLPGDWIEKKSKTHNKSYYVNSVTKVKTWKNPLSTAAKNVGTKLKKPAKRKTIYVPPPVDAVLPEGWVQKNSLTKGKPYYVFTATKFATWIHPSMM